MTWLDAGTRNFYTVNTPIETLEDLSGLRIRVAQSQLMYDMVRALGATPVTVTFDEVYSALETSTIDGAENNWPSYESKQHWEVAPYITQDAHNRIPELQLCAQAMCLEEMLCCEIPKGALFYGEPRRRTAVAFTPELRQMVRDFSEEMHQYARRGYTPKPKPTKSCSACSLKELCLPQLTRRGSVSAYLNQAMEEGAP